MKIIDNLLCNISNTPVYDRLCSGKGVFIDIETTGLKRDSSIIYLIGLLFPPFFSNDGKWCQKLIFAESPHEEREILTKAAHLLSDKEIQLISFNGRRFDIPFLLKRMEKNAITPPACLTDGTDIDILALLRPYRRSFGLSHFDQKSIEKMLGVEREDRYSGGELIKVYFDFCSSNDAALLDMLLTHNREDVLGMTEILPILNYIGIFNAAAGNEDISINEIKIEAHEGFDGSEAKELIAEVMLPVSVPKPHLFHNYRLFLEMRENKGVLRIPVLSAELKHFFEDYKNYHYIPKEDRAVLKEIAVLMDASETEKAKASNCYIRHNGDFLPLPQDFSLPGYPVYKQDYKSKAAYILYDDSLKKDPALKDYILTVLSQSFK